LDIFEDSASDLIQKSEAELLRTPNFGRTSLKEVKGLLNLMSFER